jgi:spore coat protein U-like protein
MPFQVRGKVINDCNISIGNIAFPDSKPAEQRRASTANMSIRCSVNTAYRIVLSYGGNASGTTR